MKLEYRLIGLGTCAVLVASGLHAEQNKAASADPVVVETPAVETAAKEKEKDIVLDRQPAPAAAAPGRIAPTPGATGAAPQVSVAAKPPAALRTPLHDAALAASLADLGLGLMREQSLGAGSAERNAVLSPLSIATTLGMVHAGSGGATRREIAALLAPTSAGNRAFSVALPGLISAISSSGNKIPALSSVSRIWVDQQVVPELPGPYREILGERYRADGQVIAFSKAEEARSTINQWVSKATGKKVEELLPANSITPTTKVVLVNAVYFKSPWAEPFELENTADRPFQLTSGKSIPVKTMQATRSVRTGVVDNITVYELPFKGDYSLLVALPPAGHTLNALETDLDGVDIASWSGQLKPTQCELSLPRFHIAPVSRSLSTNLQALGVKTAFTDKADFGPMLGNASAGAHLADVFHAAGITIDETGGEATAATGATVVSKSLPLNVRKCAIDRPFVFAITHKPTGAPVFMGKVANPAAK